MRQLLKRTILALVFVSMTSAGALVVAPATAQAQIGVHIGVDIPVFPRLVVVPGYPVYYAPDLRANYFFYDGLFWVFNVDDGYWYSSSWYNGPWVVVEPDFVPQPILVVPYRYYHVRPAYWRGWAYDHPPRWDIYWGPRWVEHHHGWDHWDRGRRWTAAPLPLFQRDFPRDRYPSPDRQVTIYRERYNYRPRDVVVREHETRIIERQARGGERAHARADFIERGPREGHLREQERDQRQAVDRANRQRQEDLRRQDRARREDNNQAERAQRRADNQRREDLRQQDRAQRDANRQRQEDLRQQDRAQRNAADRADRQRQEDLRRQDRSQRESNIQAERNQRQAARQRQEDLRQQDRAQRQAVLQANRQRQEDIRQQDRVRRDANVQADRANRQRQENIRQEDRAQHQANAQAERAQRQDIGHQDRAQRQANAQERGRDRKAPERGDERG